MPSSAPRAILPLPEELVNQIAAGEVIERPASVVKELVENSLDAGATRIEVTVEGGGRELVQVWDDGSGIPPADLELCWLRHTTSKLRNLEELYGLPTNGFRGEALASIASISRMSVESRTEEDPVAHRISLESGRLVSRTDAARERGTTVRIEDLFHNTPVRARFLGSQQTETGRILDILQRLALASPEVSFKLTQQGRELLNLRRGDRATRVREILGTGVARYLQPVEQTIEGVHLSGYLGSRETARQRRQQYLFLDRRPIWNAAILRALTQGCAPMNCDGHPAAVLFLELPAGEFDINVHPAKREVRFSDESRVFSAVVRGLRASLAELPTPLSPEAGRAPSGTRSPSFPQAMTPSAGIPFSEGMAGRTSQEGFSTFEWTPRFTPAPDTAQLTTDLFSGGEIHFPSSEHRPIAGQGTSGGSLARSTDPEPATPPLLVERPFLQVGLQYVIIESREGLLVIDQVAARERILFEQARQRLHNGKVPSQQLLFPELAELGPEPSLWIEEHRATLATLGFILEPFGNHCWQLRGTPPELDPERALQVLQQIAAELARGATAEDPSDATARVYARHAAQVTPRELTKEERDVLVDDLFGSADPWHAPDGRKAVIPITLAELARRFANP